MVPCFLGSSLPSSCRRSTRKSPFCFFCTRLLFFFFRPTRCQVTSLDQKTKKRRLAAFLSFVRERGSVLSLSLFPLAGHAGPRRICMWRSRGRLYMQVLSVSLASAECANVFLIFPSRRSEMETGRGAEKRTDSSSFLGQELLSSSSCSWERRG